MEGISSEKEKANDKPKKRSGKMRLHKVLFILIFLVTETVLKVVYLAFKTKFFENFHTYDSFFKILSQQAYYFGTVKLLLGAIGYGLFYYTSEAETSDLKMALQHSLVFFVLILTTYFLFLQTSNNFIDLMVLTLIAFFCSYTMLRFKKDWL